MWVTPQQRDIGETIMLIRNTLHSLASLAQYIGLDTLKFIMDGWHKHAPGLAGTELVRPSPLLDAMIEEGSLGRKNGRGFYSYEGGGKELVPNAGSAALKRLSGK